MYRRIGTEVKRGMLGTDKKERPREGRAREGHSAP